MPFEYFVDYIDNYDGDTITFLVDKGFEDFGRREFRLKGVDTYEVKGTRGIQKEKALKAKNLVRWYLTRAVEIEIKTYRKSRKDPRRFKRSFVRYIADVKFVLEINGKRREYDLAERIKFKKLNTGKYEDE